MELQEDRGPGPYIQSYTEGVILIDDVEHRHSVIVVPEQTVLEWAPQSLLDLAANDIKLLVNFKPDLILLGTGPKQTFLAAELLAAAYEAGIPVEIMSTQAACRTYNLLMSEHRSVLAALLLY